MIRLPTPAKIAMCLFLGGSVLLGCSEPAKPTGTAGSSPSLDSKNADERAAAAQDAAKKYGTGS